MPFGIVTPVGDIVMALTPLAEIPIVLDAGRYKPVLVLPKKFSDGAPTDPGAKVADVNELDVLLVVL